MQEAGGVDVGAGPVMVQVDPAGMAVAVVHEKL